MKQALLPILLLLAFLSLDAQITDYNFKEYRQAETDFHFLEFAPSLNGLHQSRQSGSLDPDQNNHSISLILPLSGFRLINTIDKKETLSYNASFSPRVEWGKFQNVDRSEFTSFSRVGVNWTREHYKNYDQWVWGYGVDYNVNWLYNVKEGQVNPVSSTEETINSVNQTPGVFIRFGKGRVENISNAWHAFRILNRLHFKGYLQESPSIIDINRFGQFLDELKTKRIFDDRLRYIAQLQYLDFQLQDEFGISETSTIQYFSELNDMWGFGISENRLMGSRFYADLYFNSFFDHYHREQQLPVNFEVNRNTFGFGPALSLNYENNKPIKTNYQFNYYFNIRADYYTYDGDLILTGNLNNDWRIAPGAGALLAYYPTTRTEYSLSVGYNAFWNGTFDDIAPSLNTRRVDELFASFSAQYFINPRTLFSASLNARYLSDLSTIGAFRGLGRPIIFQANNVNVNYNLGLVHYFR